jgi:hypothetical protein
MERKTHSDPQPLRRFIQRPPTFHPRPPSNRPQFRIQLSHARDPPTRVPSWVGVEDDRDEGGRDGDGGDEGMEGTFDGLRRGRKRVSEKFSCSLGTRVLRFVPSEATVCEGRRSTVSCAVASVPFIMCNKREKASKWGGKKEGRTTDLPRAQPRLNCLTPSLQFADVPRDGAQVGLEDGEEVGELVEEEGRLLDLVVELDELAGAFEDWTREREVSSSRDQRGKRAKEDEQERSCCFSRRSVSARASR